MGGVLWVFLGIMRVKKAQSLSSLLCGFGMTGSKYSSPKTKRPNPVMQPTCFAALRKRLMATDRRKQSDHGYQPCTMTRNLNPNKERTRWTFKA